MSTSTEIRAAQDRVAEAFRRKPSVAFSTVRGSASVADDLLCNYRQDGHEVAMDMGTVLGGAGVAPTPGFYFRAAIAGCAAMGIKMTAAREGMEIEAINVDIEMDFDDSALLGMGTNPAAPLETRLVISLQSREDGKKLKAMVDRALASDPFFLALRDSQKVITAFALEST
jgi:uncharacterized OsmC-like protein